MRMLLLTIVAVIVLAGSDLYAACTDRSTRAGLLPWSGRGAQKTTAACRWAASSNPLPACRRASFQQANAPAISRAPGAKGCRIIFIETLRNRLLADSFR